MVVLWGWVFLMSEEPLYLPESLEGNASSTASSGEVQFTFGVKCNLGLVYFTLRGTLRDAVQVRPAPDCFDLQGTSLTKNTTS